MRLVDAKVSREDWATLYDRGVCARLKGPDPAAILALTGFIAKVRRSVAEETGTNL